MTSEKLIEEINAIFWNKDLNDDEVANQLLDLLDENQEAIQTDGSLKGAHRILNLWSRTETETGQRLDEVQELLNLVEPVVETVIVWAFENRKEKGLYLCDGIDCYDDEHNEHGDVKDLSQAFVVFGYNLKEPNEKELSEMKRFMRSLKFSVDWDNDVEPYYKAVKVGLTKEQVNIIRERNE